ncbi:MAG: Release factor glutamine methyltransferase [Candidatus Anoxychlamydiales bacterium]|nr:Release factor glutamine methyltransferase [Candidatus Anoxychlamydiales bacterium]NGX35786.1 Release factor glutamine methyltransferase [Candidatus Anoxychlamydiales bacterium]
MDTILNLLKSATSFLEKKGIKNAKVSANFLLGHVLKIKANDLALYSETKVSKKEIEQFKGLIERRAKNEPLEYILEKIDFYGCKLFINSDVLIPRQETEILVEMIAKKLEKESLEGKTLFDICTGSGCIGIALKKRFPKLKVYLSDISKKALDIAKKNAKKNGVNVFFKEGDLFLPFTNLKADFIICNPPYVSEEEYRSLDKDVYGFEPEIAISAKDKGLEFYKRIYNQIFDYANKGAKAFFEIGQNQGDDILNIFTSNKCKNKKVYQDYSSKERFFFVEIE